MIGLDQETIDVMMPMHLRIDRVGVIRGVGPTLARLRQPGTFINHGLGEVFDMRTTRLASRARAGIPLGEKIHLKFKNAPHTSFKGVAMPLAGTDDLLVNLSFGISLIDAVSDYRLTASDFAVTDLAVEMLYLVEAKSAVLEETKQLNSRLQGAKVEAEEQASSDTLTGLRNRRAMDAVLARMIKNRMKFSLLHLDLDYFKSVNDTFGHAAGDHVLQGVARILIEETRGDDLVARVGGDEFVILLNKLTDEERLTRISERIIERLEVPVDFKGEACMISGSIGVTTTEKYVVPDADEMLNDADMALYSSKGRGKACVSFFDISMRAPRVTAAQMVRG